MLKALYPELSDSQLREMDELFGRFVASCQRLYERINSDPEASALFGALTASASVRYDDLYTDTNP